ncbi:amidohydrolase [Ferrimonas marina]|uniref:Amidohydrolase 3 domain-containing protein n=1 Tax=Ferrimonas marina TaxID=299255 RepID=A0A1M5YED9_9GAMM|nr:amidohydrolase [Ferrimonas marina]SHI10264.1 hypothetical protein SAMN02745129_4136 [Ferrimonas marina]
MLRLIPLLLFCPWLMAAQSSLQQLAEGLEPEQPVTLFVAATIHTLDPLRPQAKAVAVHQGRILAVGDEEVVSELLKDYQVRVDRRFEEKVLVPGLIEPHLHPLLSALTLTSEIIAIEPWQLPSGTVPAAKDQAAFRQRLSKADEALAPADQLLLVWGYHHYFHGPLDKGVLDGINAKRPIVVWHRSAHEFYLNSAALQQFGIDAGFVEQLDSEARAQVSLEQGHFYEQGMFALLPKLAPAIATPERLEQGLRLTRDYLHQAGVTLAAEPGGIQSKPLQDAQNAVLGESDTPFRFFYIPDGKSLAQQHLDGDLIGETEKLLSWGAGNTQFLPKQVKLFADGAIFSQLMQVQEPYLDGHQGEWIMPPSLFSQAFKAYWDAGYQIHIHQNGDAALAMILQVLKENQQRTPRQDHRTTLVHFGMADQAQVQELKLLGAIVSANPYYPVALADRYGEIGLGPARADQMVRLGDVSRAGIPLSLHSDMPMAPAQPLYLMWAAVNRQTSSGRVAGPEQRLRAPDALKAVTLGAAYALRMEQEVGSIEVGKRADFTVLDSDPLTVPAEAINTIKVWGTVLAGRVQPVAPDSQAEPPKAEPGPGASEGEFGATPAATQDEPLAQAVLAHWQKLLQHQH